jgi:hypothetical protein
MIDPLIIQDRTLFASLSAPCWSNQIRFRNKCKRKKDSVSFRRAGYAESACVSAHPPSSAF